MVQPWFFEYITKRHYLKLFPAISVVMNGKDGHRLKFEKESPTVIIMFSAP